MQRILRSKKSILITAVIASIFLVMWGQDIWRHRTLEGAVDAVEQSLREPGVDATINREDGCAYHDGKDTVIGKGYKQCQLRLVVGQSVSSVEASNELLGSLNQTLAKHMEIITPLPTDMRTGMGVQLFEGGRYTVAGRECVVQRSYDTNGEEVSGVTVGVICDDTSWFARIFQNNNSPLTIW